MLKLRTGRGVVLIVMDPVTVQLSDVVATTLYSVLAVGLTVVVVVPPLLLHV